MKLWKQVSHDVKEDFKIAKKIHLRWKALLCIMICAFFACMLFDRFGRLELALPVMNSFFLFSFVIYLKWQIRKQIWFWNMMALFAIAQVLLLCFIVWPTRWVPASSWSGGACIELMIMLVCLSLVGRLIGEPEPSAPISLFMHGDEPPTRQPATTRRRRGQPDTPLK
jgi:hypothetical protein